MELVSATKMRKAQQIALDSRPYAFAALELLANISVLEGVKKEELPALFETRKKINKVLFVLIASDKGLAGAFNNSVFKKFELHLREEKSEWKREEHLYLAVGEKAFQYLNKKGLKIAGKFAQAGDFATPDQTNPIAEFITEGFINGKWDRVIAVSTHFRTALKQEPHVRRILPIDFDHVKDTIKEIIPEKGKFAELIKEHNLDFLGVVAGKNPTSPRLRGAQYLIEPNPKFVLEKITKHLFFMQVYHLILEANASEHSARRMAMKTASDNAGDLGEKLNLQYNKSRQSRITIEISEISAGAEALQ